MIARRFLTAAALAATMAGAACSNGGPTLSEANEDEGGIAMIPEAPTDTSGFVPPDIIP